MNIYTIQLSQWRKLANTDIVLIDTTVKTGFVQLAPTWDMVLGVKKGTMSPEEYTHRYLALMEYWWFQDPLFFEDLFKNKAIALGCYCQKGLFCHRHLLANFLSKAQPVNLLGEYGLSQ